MDQYQQMEVIKEGNQGEKYRKEYLYYRNHQLPILHEYRIDFQIAGRSNALPSALIDHYAEEPALYLLYCTQQQHSTKLIIQPFQSSNSIHINYNTAPSHIVITDNHLFSFSQQQLFITDLTAPTQPIAIPLIYGQIVEVSLCFRECGQSGVLVIFFNAKDGYIKRQYSKSSSYSRWERYINLLRLKMDEHERYEQFQIIIPNLIGLVYKNKAWFVFDLNEMKVVEKLTSIAIDKGEGFKIRYNMVEVDQEGNDGIVMAISNGSQIVIYGVYVVRLKVVMEHIRHHHQFLSESQFVPLNMIAGGKVIDWQKSNIKKHDLHITTDQHISTLQITNNQLSYIHIQKGYSFIPQLTTIHLSTLNKSTTILKQSAIWLNYFKDLSSHHSGLQDKLLLPNRYDKKITEQLLGNTQMDMDNNKQRVQNREQILLLAVNKWRQYDQLSQLIIFNHRLFILRKNTLNQHQTISELQYQLQSFTQAQKSVLQQINHSRGEAIDPCQQKSKRNRDLVDKQYMNLLVTFKKYGEFYYEEEEGYKVSLPLLQGVIEDKIIYFGQFFKYCGVVHPEPAYFKNVIITKVLHYFYNQLTHSYTYYKIFGSSLLDLLLQIHSALFVNDLEANLYIFFKIIFQNILPERYTQIEHQDGRFATNQYLQFIITLLIANNQDEKKQELLQSQLKRYFSEIFVITQKEYSTIIYNNSSLIQAYLLTHPQNSQLQVFYAELLRRHSYEDVVRVVCRVSDLIGDSVDCLFKVQLKERTSKEMVKLFMDESLQSKTLKSNEDSGNHKQRTLEMAKEILLKSKINKPSFEHSMITLTQQLLTLQTITLQQYAQNTQNINSILKSILPFQIAHENYSNILQIKQACLIHHITFFNAQTHNLLADGNPNDLVVLLVQIEQFYYQYKKYFSKVYLNAATSSNKSCELKNGSSQVVDLVRQWQFQECISCNQFLSEQLRVSDIICSEILLKLLKEILSSQLWPQVIKKYRKWYIQLNKYIEEKANNNHPKQIVSTPRPLFIFKIIEEYLKLNIISNMQSLVPYLHYYLYKKGKTAFKRIITEQTLTHQLIDYHRKNQQIKSEHMLQVLQETSRQLMEDDNFANKLKKRRNL